MLKEGKSGTEIIFALQRMGLTPVDAAQYYGAAKLSSPRAYDSLDKAIRMVCDSTRAYNQYYNSIRDENYEIASRLFRQAEQDDELTDQEVDKLLLFFKSKFGKGPR